MILLISLKEVSLEPVTGYVCKQSMEGREYHTKWIYARLLHKNTTSTIKGSHYMEPLRRQLGVIQFGQNDVMLNFWCNLSILSGRVKRVERYLG